MPYTVEGMNTDEGLGSIFGFIGNVVKAAANVVGAVVPGPVGIIAKGVTALTSGGGGGGTSGGTTGVADRSAPDGGMYPILFLNGTAYAPVNQTQYAALIQSGATTSSATNVPVNQVAPEALAVPVASGSSGTIYGIPAPLALGAVGVLAYLLTSKRR